MSKREGIQFNEKEIRIPFFRVGVPEYTVEELEALLKFGKQS